MINGNDKMDAGGKLGGISYPKNQARPVASWLRKTLVDKEDHPWQLVYEVGGCTSGLPFLTTESGQGFACAYQAGA